MIAPPSTSVARASKPNTNINTTQIFAARVPADGDRGSARERRRREGEVGRMKADRLRHRERARDRRRRETARIAQTKKDQRVSGVRLDCRWVGPGGRQIEDLSRAAG